MTTTSAPSGALPTTALRRSAQAESRLSPDRSADVPVRADGVELLGELPGSGYRTPPSLVRRSDGQTVQLTRLLYTVLAKMDGVRTYDEIAATVSKRVGRLVTADDVRLLAETRLRPIGVLRNVDGSQPTTRKSDPLLGLRFRLVVSRPSITRRITAPFAWLFHPVVATLIVGAFIAMSAWVLFEKGLASATFEAFNTAGLLLLIFAVTAVSAGFHEFGHAAACRSVGATPGAMGAGLYLVWPAFYTDVTDSYRLGRSGRVRVDLGGLYFNAVFAVGMFAAWLATGWDPLLLIIVAQVLQMLRQLAPLVRFDGYHILADVTGVPDLYAHIKPTLLGLLPTRWGRPETKTLKFWARAVVTLWVLVVVPVLLATMLLMLLAFPRVAATAWQAVGTHWRMLTADWRLGEVAGAGVQLLKVMALALPVVATAYLLTRVLRRTARSVYRATDGHPVRRAVAALAAAAVAATVAWAWWPRPDMYRPIQPHERWTVTEPIHRTAHPANAGPSQPRLRTGEVATTRTIWPASRPWPTQARPSLALVLVPRSDPSAQTWVFPFDRPDAPGVGDNQALAVNMQDGSIVYDVAFALVWVTDGEALNVNEAYAFANCTDCAAVAVAFQVVMVVGEADVVIPQNLAVAANYECLRCVTAAIASQLVVTLPGELSEASMAELAALWQQIERFAQRIVGLPIEQIMAQLESYKAEILAIIQRDPAMSATPTPGAGSSTSTPSPLTGHLPGTSTATPHPAPAPGTGPTDGPTGEPSPTSDSTDSPSPSPTESPSAEPTPTEPAPSPTG